MQCRGFLFDLDGTLVDSLPVVERSWCHWADRQGIDHQDVLNFIHGKQAITSLRHFLAGRSEEEIQAEFKYLEQIEATDTEGITALPGARELLEHLIETLETRGVLTLWLEVRASNHAAIALYESLGFNEATIRRNYYPTAEGREDAIVMALPIGM